MHHEIIGDVVGISKMLTVFNSAFRVLAFDHFLVVLSDCFDLAFQVIDFLKHFTHVRPVAPLRSFSINRHSAADNRPRIRFLIGRFDVLHQPLQL